MPLNAGDALAVLGFDVLRSNADRLGRRVTALVLDEFTSAMWRTLEGQALELGWRRDGITALTPGDYLELVLHKTCWYSTIAPLRIGALIGSRGSAELGALTRFAVLLGTAFQITDDLLNLTGAAAVYGKDIGGDLREGKRTLMLIHALAAASPAERAAIVSWLQRPDFERPDEDVEWLAGVFERCGSLSFARHFARGIADAAADALPVAFEATPRPETAGIVAQLVDYVVERTR